MGDLKILYHAGHHRYRVLLRRDQIHKIATNHIISKDQKLEPMLGSESAVTYFAMDFAEGSEEPKLEKLAVKFKHVETKDLFKQKFEEAQAELAKPKPQVRILLIIAASNKK